MVDVRIVSIQGKAWFRTEDGRVFSIEQGQLFEQKGELILDRGAKLVLSFGDTDSHEFVGPGKLAIDPALPSTDNEDELESLDAQDFQWVLQPAQEQDFSNQELGAQISEGWHYVVVLRRVGEDLDGFRPIGAVQNLEPDLFTAQAARLLGDEPLDPDPVDPDPDPVGPDPLTPVVPPDPDIPNRPPETQDLYFTIPEDTSIDSDIPGSDPDRDPLTYTIIADPEHGSVTLDPETGAFVYTPDADYFGPDQFQVAVSDGQQTVSQTTYIEVTPVNDPPVAEDLYLTTPEDTPIPGGITASDVDGDTLTYTVITPPSFGEVEFNEQTGSFNYQPGLDYVGEDQFTVLIDDGNGGTTEAVVYITVTPLNDPPVTQDLYITTPEDTPVPGGIVASDIDGDALTYTVVDQPAFGEVEFNNTTGTFEYQPDPDYVGEDQFTVLVDDGNGGTAQAVVYITVTPVQDPAIISGDDIGAVIEDESDPTLRDEGKLEISDPDAGEEQFDPNSVMAQGDTLGSMSLSSDGSWQYQLSNSDAQYLAAGEQRIETFTVASVDGTTAEVEVTVTGVNDAPEVFTVSGDTDSATLTETNDPLAASGRLSTTDVDIADYVRADVIDVQISGNSGSLSNSALLAMLSVNSGDVIASGDAEGAVNWRFNSGSEAFDFLPQDDTLTLEYTVEVTDSFGASATHPVTILITGTNDAPVITGGDQGEVIEDASDPELTYNGQLEGYDPDGNESAVNDAIAPIAVGTVLGSLSITADGAWTYVVANADVQYLAESEIREERFLITTADGTQHEMIVQIHGRNDAPEIFLEAGDSDTASLVESDSAAQADGNLSAEDVDVIDQATVSVLDVSENIPGAFDKALLLSMFSVDSGAVILSGETSGDIQWSFDSGDETFNVIPEGVQYILTYTVQITDSIGAIDTHEVTITITGTDDKPVFTGGDSGGVTEDLNVQPGNVLTYSDQLLGFDPDYGQSQINDSIPPRAINNVLGSLVIDSLGNWTYEVDNAATQYLAQGQSNFDLFQVTTVDGATHVIAVQIHGTNDAPVISVQVGDADTASLLESNENLRTEGTLTVSDVDVRDTVTPVVDSVSVTFGGSVAIDNATLLSMFSVDAVAVISSGDTTGKINWLFDSQSEAFDFLSEGDSLVLTYLVSVEDNFGAVDQHEISITITGTNDKPRPVPQGIDDQKNEDLELIAAVDISSSFNDVDNGDVLSFSATGLPPGLNISASGVITGTLDSSASVGSPYVVEVTATDAQGATAVQEFTWVITNPAPDFINETTGVDDDTYEYTVYEGVITETAVIQAQDPDGDSLSYSIIAGNEDGLFAIDSATGEMRITREVDDPDLGVRELIVEVDDGEGGRDLGTVVVTLLNVNDPPIVYSDLVQVQENQGIDARVPTPFDIDSAIDPLGYQLIDDSGITGGSLTFNADGSYYFDTLTDFEYLAQGETTTVSFTYRLEDSEPDFDNNSIFSDPATITIEVVGVNDVPSFSGEDTASITEDSGVYDASGTLLVNDVDVGESAIDATRPPVSQGNNLGSLSIFASGEWNYTVDNADLQYLAANEVREEVFTVFSVDGTEHYVSITLNGVNDAPNIRVKGSDVDSISLSETDEILSSGGRLSVTDIDVADVVTPSVTSVNVQSGNSGSLNNSALLAMVSVDVGAVVSGGATDGKINWTFDSGNNDAFDYLPENDSLVLEYVITATDSEGATDSQTVTVTIVGTNDEPEVLDDVVSTDEDTPYSDVVPTAIDDDGSVLSYTTAGSPALPSGLLTFNADGSYTMNPVGAYDYLAQGETTEFVFSYRALDDAGDVSDFGQITVTILGVDDPTQVSTGSGTVREDTTFDAAGQLKVFDIDNPNMSFVANTYSDAYGTLVVATDGSWSYTLNQNSTVDALEAGETHSQVYTISLSDGGDSATVNDDNVTTTVTIDIKGVNDIPTVEDLNFSVLESNNLELRSVAGSDIDGTIFGYGVRTDVEAGILTFQPNGIFRFQTNGEFDYLAAGEEHNVSFTYAAADNNGALSESGTVTITIIGVDNAPVIGTGSGSVVEDLEPTATGVIAANDIDNPNLEFIASTYVGAYGDLTVNADGSWSYTLRSTDADPLDQGDVETETINGVALNDGSVTSVSIDITGTNDAPLLNQPLITISVNEDNTLNDYSLSSVSDVDSDDSVGGYTLIDGSEFPAGSLIFNTDGTFTIDPRFQFDHLNEGESEEVSFTYRAFDSHGEASDIGTVTVTVEGATDGPSDPNVVEIVEGDAPDEIIVTGGPLDNFVQGTYTDSSGYGELVVDSNGYWTYTLNNPALADEIAAGEDVTLNINAGGSDDVTVTIIGTNDEPVVTNVGCGTFETGENSTLTGSVPVGTDVDGTVVSYRVVDSSGLAGGSITFSNDGTFIFDPGTAFDPMDAGDIQSLSFTYQGIDNNGAVSNVGSVCITINGEDDLPSLTTGSGSVIEDDMANNSAAGALSFTDIDEDDAAGNAVFVVQSNSQGTYGSFSIDASGNWVYTLDNNDPDTDELNHGEAVTETFNVSSDRGDTTVTITVTGTNDIPVIDSSDPNIAATTDEDSILNGTLPSATDVDSSGRIVGYVQNGGLIYSSDSSAAPGELIFYADGSYVFDPVGYYDYLAEGESTTVEFSFSAVDNESGVSVPQTVAITITGVDDAPVISSATVTVSEDDSNPAASGSLTADDPDGDAVLTFNPETIEGTYGSLTIDANGQWTYSLSDDAQSLGAGETGVDTINVGLSDGSSTTVTVNVEGINDIPTGEDVTVTIDEDSSISGVLPAATDVDGNVIAYRLAAGSFTGPGTVRVNTDGSYTYDPGDSFQGLDAGDTAEVSFQYLVQDNNDGISEPITVTIVVTGVNDAPTSTVIEDQSSDEGASISLNLSSYFNDVDEDNVFTFSATGLPPSLSIDSSTGVISGNLNADAAVDSPYSVEVTATDSEGVLVSRSFTWSVNNPAPDFVNETSGLDDDMYTFVVSEDDALGTVVGSSVAVDPDSDELTYAIVSGNAAGLFAMDTATGEITLARTAGDEDVGSYSLQVLVDDGEGGTDTATVNIDVANVNDAPVAYTNTLTVDEESTATPLGLSSPVDADGDSLTITVTSLPAVGVITLSDGNAVEINDALTQAQLTGLLYNAPDEIATATTVTFSYTVDDGQGESNSVQTGGVDITINPVNDAPVAVDDEVSNVPNNSAGYIIDVLSNDVDSDGDALTVISAYAQFGEVSINSDGTLTYVPDTDYSGEDSIVYRISDTSGMTDVGRVAITVSDASVAAAPASYSSTWKTQAAPEALPHGKSSRLKVADLLEEDDGDWLGQALPGDESPAYQTYTSSASAGEGYSRGGWSLPFVSNESLEGTNFFEPSQQNIDF
ncbi:VCBS domain-containing protein [Gilvimarinus chinensis]|uniref:VCBS domain-containing protein n=1 Tax=Gilvimarinus chinensis TaxID=396005 RepID=UPI00039F310E|nr:VCBS domain-containing protein [Gilvimarinus chinensis]